MFRNKKRLFLYSLPVFPVLAYIIHLQLRGPVSSHLVGDWQIVGSNATVLYSLKPDGEYKSITTFKSGKIISYQDGSGAGRPLVFKGSYSLSKDSIRLFNFKRYIQVNGVDQPFGSCGNTLSDVGCHEILNFDRDLSAKGDIRQVRWPPLGSNRIIVTGLSHISGIPPVTSVWTRQ